MAVSVIIQRTIKDKEAAAQVAPLMLQLRSRASVQPGFLTDQTFSCIDCDGEYLVISTWHTLEEWETWMHSEERMAIQHQIDDILGEETRYRYYEPVVGSIPPMFNQQPL